MQAMQDAIQVRAAVGQSLFNCPLHQRRRVLLMQAQHPDEFLDPSPAFRPFLSQDA